MGAFVGFKEGKMEGIADDGTLVGFKVGRRVGEVVGLSEGIFVGFVLGVTSGNLDGWIVGVTDAKKEGKTDGPLLEG